MNPTRVLVLTKSHIPNIEQGIVYTFVDSIVVIRVLCGVPILIVVNFIPINFGTLKNNII